MCVVCVFTNTDRSNDDTDPMMTYISGRQRDMRYTSVPRVSLPNLTLYTEPSLCLHQSLLFFFCSFCLLPPSLSFARSLCLSLALSRVVSLIDSRLRFHRIQI